MSTKNINLVADFTDCPGGRERATFDFSGEEFREDFLLKALQSSERVIVDMNGAFTIPPSFLDEAFGILIDRWGIDEYNRRVSVVLTDDPIAAADYKDVVAKHSAARKKRVGV